MTENGYARDIRKKCEALGVWRDEFDRTLRRLAKIYTRIDAVEELFKKSGGAFIVKHTNKAGAENAMRNPYIAELDILYDQALTYERELGITAAALKKINESALKAKEDSPLAELGKILKMG